MVEDCLDDSLGGFAIAIWIAGFRHTTVFLLIGEKLLGLFVHYILICANKLHSAGFYGLWTLCSVSQYQYRLTQCWSFLLYATGIGENQMRAMHQVGKWLIVQWVHQMDLSQSTQLLINDLTNLWILVYRENNLHILKLLNQMTESLIYMAHWFTQILAAVSGN